MLRRRRARTPRELRLRAAKLLLAAFALALLAGHLGLHAVVLAPVALTLAVLAVRTHDRARR
ncbi:MAG: hypothetical protein NVSMB51_00640 [Solirubrobacteraceae bacterium]